MGADHCATLRAARTANAGPESYRRTAPTDTRKRCRLRPSVQVLAGTLIRVQHSYLLVRRYQQQRRGRGSGHTESGPSHSGPCGVTAPTVAASLAFALPSRARYQTSRGFGASFLHMHSLPSLSAVYVYLLRDRAANVLTRLKLSFTARAQNCFRELLHSTLARAQHRITRWGSPSLHANPPRPESRMNSHRAIIGKSFCPVIASGSCHMPNACSAA